MYHKEKNSSLLHLLPAFILQHHTHKHLYLVSSLNLFNLSIGGSYILYTRRGPVLYHRSIFFSHKKQCLSVTNTF